MQHSIADILRTSNYGLDLFTADEVAALELIDKRGKPYLHDPIRGKDVRAKPEEIVRQLFLRQLLGKYGYPLDQIGVEKAVRMGRDTSKSADIIVTDADDPQAAYVIVEVKRPKEKKGIEQLKTYANAKGAPLAVWTNGATIRILHREEKKGKGAEYVALDRLPLATEDIEDVLNRDLTIDQLAEENRLVTERLTLKSIILDLENLVLANSGVDAFEEVFKLIYAKLYDEWAATNERKDRLVQFRVAGTETKTAERLRTLFDAAKEKWPGVFLDGETINLTPGQIKTCVSFLQGIKLFNSNLQVIDEAFEYLTVAVAKGSKGQYFTPRHVIDMAVMMTDPQRDEYVIDTAAGSCGFTVHALFHVWGDEFTADGPKPWQAEYAREKVYALDFDARSVKVARALNLIAGDGKTNVYRANTLDPREWDEEVRVGLKPRLRRGGTAAERRENEEAMRFFDFDVLLANPPFAGDIADARILRQYELSRKVESVDPDKLADDPEALAAYRRNPFARYREKSGSWADKQPRDVLFIERNLDFLRPGGRMAVVLPQGRFNNVTDGYLRAWIAEHARIVAVVSVGIDTFKPHTNTKTSVLFLQKWNEDEESDSYNPRRDNYDIFFATSKHSGKNGRGEYVYLADPEDGGLLLDLEGHPIVDHDLFDPRTVLRGQMERQRARLAGNPEALAAAEARYKRLLTVLPQRETIAEAFAAFAREEKLSFGTRPEEALPESHGEPTERTYSAPFSATASAERLDAEHFSPHVRAAVAHAERMDGVRLGAIGDVLKGKTPKGYTESGVPVIRSGDLSDIEDTASFKRTLPKQARFKLKRGDVLISSIGYGSIGKVQIFDHPEPHTTVSEVTVVRQSVLNPYYLQAYLASPPGQIQIESWVTGATGQLHLRPADVEKIVVPVVDREVQDEFERIAMEARRLRAESVRLLEEAKARVEALVLSA